MMPSRLLTSQCLFTLALLTITVSNLHSEQIYKYQDEQGKWHYSQRASHQSGEVKLEVNSSKEKRLYKKVWVKEHVGASPSLSIINKYHGPIQAKLSINCDACVVINKQVDIVVPADSDELALHIDPKNRGWTATYKLSVVLGDPKAIPDSDYIYRLPFQELIDFQITQSFNGKFSHRAQGSIHAIDIAMPIATPVLAARDGTVMAIEESNTEAGTDPSYASKANTVYILHSDGTIGVYAHLDMFSVIVQPGSVIRTGDFLARSGNTGFSTGPHLHFTVWHNDKGEQKTVNFRFDDGDGGHFIPHGGQLINHGFGKVKQTVPAKYAQLYQGSLDSLALLENKDNSDVKVTSLENAINTGKSYINRIKALLE
ncbi:MAG: murein DD-endopeptidase MepM/ murein hydrolase activator NlpD [Pseudohongiellaceae bacterium]|jgi:murein DD-endopeptidase MepM/ murein hydrolase activator NlpD